MPKPHVHLEATAPTVNGVRSSLVKRLHTPHDDQLPARSASSLEFVDLLRRRQAAQRTFRGTTLGVLQQAVKAAQPFDVALMGCGGYGLPLAAYIRGNLSRSAIYVGGGLQLMFGITGSRWLGRADMKPLVNEFWVRPSASETPVNAIQFERASYF